MRIGQIVLLVPLAGCYMLAPIVVEPEADDPKSFHISIGPPMNGDRAVKPANEAAKKYCDGMGLTSVFKRYSHSAFLNYQLNFMHFECRPDR